VHRRPGRIQQKRAAMRMSSTFLVLDDNPRRCIRHFAAERSRVKRHATVATEISPSARAKLPFPFGGIDSQRNGCPRIDIFRSLSGRGASFRSIATTCTRLCRRRGSIFYVRPRFSSPSPFPPLFAGSKRPARDDASLRKRFARFAVICVDEGGRGRSCSKNDPPERRGRVNGERRASRRYL